MKLSNINDNKKYIIIIIGLLFICAIGFTFAFFQAQNENGKSADINVKSYTVDNLSFDIGDDITLNPNQFNFAEGKGNLEGITNASVILQANNKTKLAKMNYYAYVVVTKNEFKYTTSDKKAELVLSVEGPNGVVTSIDGLGNAIDVTDNAGNTFKAFDITEFSGVITLADNKEIEVTSSDNGKKQEDWKIKVTFINLDADQSSNSDKNFNANMLIQKEEYVPTVADVCAGKTLSDCVIAQYTLLNGHNNIYYHDGTTTDGYSEIIDAADGSYRYTGADYILTDKATSNNYHSISYTYSSTTRLIDFYCDDTKTFHGSYCSSASTSYYKAAYDTSDTQYSTYFDVIQKLIDDEYIKQVMNNYICFGSNTTPCPEGNLYRIIGTFNDNNHGVTGETLVKIIKATSYGKQKWNSVTSSDWSTSDLKDNLNTTFLNTFLSGYENKIASVNWRIYGINNLSNIARVIYDRDMDTSVRTYDGKIGLMYASDYGFAADSSFWLKKINSYNSSIYEKDWLYYGLNEWTISPHLSTSASACFVETSGSMNGVGISVVNSFETRPSFYLVSSVRYAFGLGTQSDPIYVK